MTRTKSNRRLRTLAVAGVGILAMLGATASGAQTGAAATGAHANEAFCKTIIKQAELFEVIQSALKNMVTSLLIHSIRTSSTEASSRDTIAAPGKYKTSCPSRFARLSFAWCELSP